jgi:inhibitor of KinA sporulation pathway (predicted exonuclease)
MKEANNMNYIIFDLEFNQDFISKKDHPNVLVQKCPFEIIQIGAIKLDKNLKTLSTFDSLVKPEIFKELHPYVKDITKITEEQLLQANTFSQVYEEFLQFISGSQNIFCVWGLADMKELFRNITFHKFDTSVIPKDYINIQSYASKYLNCPKGTNIGLSNAVKLLNIPFLDVFHDAYNDAYYTAEIFKKIFNKKIKAKKYNPERHIKLDSETKSTQILDTDNLYSQFAKMLKRELSKEEKRIIKLAYMMGKTGQFQVEKKHKH